MSLNFDLTKISDFKKKCYTGPSDNLRIDPITEGLIFASMYIGIDEITPKNAEKFFRRLSAYEWIHGSTLTVRDKRCSTGNRPYLYSFDDVLSHTGLSTNASTMSDAKWRANISWWVHEAAKSSADTRELRKRVRVDHGAAN